MLRFALQTTWRTLPRVAGGAGAATALLAMAACGATNTPGTGSGNGSSSATLAAMDFSFSPTQLSVPAGTSVTVSFTNNGSVRHSFTLDNGSGSVDADPGKTTTLTFTTPASGTLTFHCKYHPTQMMGTLNVGGSGGAGAGGGSSSSSSSSTSSSGGYGY
jgi:plastocyanin